MKKLLVLMAVVMAFGAQAQTTKLGAVRLVDQSFDEIHPVNVRLWRVPAHNKKAVQFYDTVEGFVKVRENDTFVTYVDISDKYQHDNRKTVGTPIIYDIPNGAAKQVVPSLLVPVTSQVTTWVNVPSPSYDTVDAYFLVSVKGQSAVRSVQGYILKTKSRYPGGVVTEGCCQVSVTDNLVLSNTSWSWTFLDSHYKQFPDSIIVWTYRTER
jgi:hypothetical protein